MKVYELLDSPEKWTQGAFARTADGDEKDHTDKDAVSFCLLGAIRKCYPSLYQRVDVLAKVRTILPDGMTIWNDADNRTHAEVLNLARTLDI